MADRVAIATGSSKGVGRGTAHALASTDLTVHLTGRTFQRLEARAADVTERGGMGRPANDFTDPAATDRMRALNERRPGRFVGR